MRIQRCRVQAWSDETPPRYGYATSSWPRQVLPSPRLQLNPLTKLTAAPAKREVTKTGRMLMQPVLNHAASNHARRTAVKLQNMQPLQGDPRDKMRVGIPDSPTSSTATTRSIHPQSQTSPANPPQQVQTQASPSTCICRICAPNAAKKKSAKGGGARERESERERERESYPLVVL